MTPADMRAWQAAMGFNFEQSAQALGVSRATFADMLSGVSHSNGRPKPIDRRTALACAALAAGLGEWVLPAVIAPK